MIKIIIAGGRKFKDYEFLKTTCNNIIKSKDIEIVSGKAPGTDSLGERYAKEKGYSIKEFPAKWDDIEGKPTSEIKINRFGKKYWLNAGFVRNEEMSNYSDALIAFWDGKSNGTKNMIELAKKLELRVFIIKY